MLGEHERALAFVDRHLQWNGSGCDLGLSGAIDRLLVPQELQSALRVLGSYA